MDTCTFFSHMKARTSVTFTTLSPKPSTVPHRKQETCMYLFNKWKEQSISSFLYQPTSVTYGNKQLKSLYIIPLCDIMTTQKIWGASRVLELYGNFWTKLEWPIAATKILSKKKKIGRNDWVSQRHSWYFWVSFFLRDFRITFFFNLTWECYGKPLYGERGHEMWRIWNLESGKLRYEFQFYHFLDKIFFEI